MKGLWLAFVLLLCGIANAVTPDADFASRSGATGVTLAEGFDNNTDLNRNDGSVIQNGYQDGCNGQQGFIDTTTKVSGTGSLRFTLTHGTTCKDIGGKWDALMKSPGFTTGDTVYVGYWYRIGSLVLSNGFNFWGSSLKLTDMYGHTSTCQSTEFTVTIDPIANSSLFGRPTWYTNCGDGWSTDVGTNAVNSGGDSSINGCSADCNFEQGSQVTPASGVGFNCSYQTPSNGVGNGTGCFIQPANTWCWMYYKLVLGTRGTNNSSIESWVTCADGRVLQWQKLIGIIWPTGGDSTVDRIYLSPYMTQLPTGSASAVDTFIWYDELIISSQPIAQPAGLSAPGIATSGVAH